MNGNVIGITTAKYYGDTIEGIGFAIPINDVMRIVADLKEYGYVTGQPYIGVTLTDMNSVTAEFYNLPWACMSIPWSRALLRRQPAYRQRISSQGLAMSR